MVRKGVGRTSWESVSQTTWHSLTHITGGGFFLGGGGRSLSAPVWCLPGGQAGEIGKDTHTHTHSHITDSQSRLPFPQAKVLEANKWKQGERKGKVPLPFNLRHLI